MTGVGKSQKRAGLSHASDPRGWRWWTTSEALSRGQNLLSSRSAHYVIRLIAVNSSTWPSQMSIFKYMLYLVGRSTGRGVKFKEVGSVMIAPHMTLTCFPIGLGLGGGHTGATTFIIYINGN